jgi:hypothetical protein
MACRLPKMRNTTVDIIEFDYSYSRGILRRCCIERIEYALDRLSCTSINAQSLPVEYFKTNTS